MAGHGAKYTSVLRQEGHASPSTIEEADMNVIYDRGSDILLITYEECTEAPVCFEKGELLLRVDPKRRALIGVTVVDFSAHPNVNIPLPGTRLPDEIAAECDELAECIEAMP